MEFSNNYSTPTSFIIRGPYQPLLNQSNFTSLEDYNNYINEYQAFYDFYYLQRIITGYVYVICGLIGIVSSILILATICKNQNFTSHCFACYKVIAISELFYMLTAVLLGICFIKSRNSSQSYTLMYMTTKFIPLRNTSSIFSDLLIIFLSIERAIACLIPTKFHLINKRNTYTIVMSASLVIACGVNLPGVFEFDIKFDQTGAKYIQTLAESWSEKADEVYNDWMEGYFFAEALLVLLSSIFAIAGMIRSIQSRLQTIRLASNSDSTLTPAYGRQKQNTQTQNIAALNQKLQLCYLQLSQAIPLLMNELLCAAMIIVSPSDLSKLTYAEAYRRWKIIFVLNLFDCLAHSFHFFQYFIFSKSFRDGFKQRFCSNNIGVSTINLRDQS